MKSVERFGKSKEENSEDFCPNYVQEFDLWSKNFKVTSRGVDQTQCTIKCREVRRTKNAKYSIQLSKSGYLIEPNYRGFFVLENKVSSLK